MPLVIVRHQPHNSINCARHQWWLLTADQFAKMSRNVPYYQIVWYCITAQVVSSICRPICQNEQKCALQLDCVVSQCCSCGDFNLQSIHFTPKLEIFDSGEDAKKGEKGITYHFFRHTQTLSQKYTFFVQGIKRKDGVLVETKTTFIYRPIDKNRYL